MRQKNDTNLEPPVRFGSREPHVAPRRPEAPFCAGALSACSALPRRCQPALDRHLARETVPRRPHDAPAAASPPLRLQLHRPASGSGTFVLWVFFLRSIRDAMRTGSLVTADFPAPRPCCCVSLPAGHVAQMDEGFGGPEASVMIFPTSLRRKRSG